jgi:hypothetical protein
LTGHPCEVKDEDYQLLIDPNNDGNFVDYVTDMNSQGWTVPTEYAKLNIVSS